MITAYLIFHRVYIQTLHGIDNVSVHSIHDGEVLSSFSPIFMRYGDSVPGHAWIDWHYVCFQGHCFGGSFQDFLLYYFLFYGLRAISKGGPGLISFFDTLSFGCYFTKRDAFCWEPGQGVRYCGMEHLSGTTHHSSLIIYGWLSLFLCSDSRLLQSTTPHWRLCIALHWA